MQPLYLSPTSVAQVFEIGDEFGLIEGPRTFTGRRPLKDGVPWAMDNDAFTGFDFWRWARALLARRQFRETCLFVACPDVVGGAEATLERFDVFEPMLHRRGWPVALVTQDGMVPEVVPWGRIEALFVGGTDEHKLGPAAGALMAAARARGKWVHVGRVNSASRLRKFWLADSWDGTKIAFEPSQAEMLARTVREIRELRRTRRLPCCM